MHGCVLKLLLWLCVETSLGTNDQTGKPCLPFTHSSAKLQTYLCLHPKKSLLDGSFPSLSSDWLDAGAGILSGGYNSTLGLTRLALGKEAGRASRGQA